MNYFKFCILIIVFLISHHTAAQEIPINKLLYPTLDFEFKLSDNGNYMASIKKFPIGYTIMITDIKKTEVYQQIPLGDNFVYNLNWISENRITFEQSGVLFAINIDGTEKQQLMSIWKEEKSHFRSYKSLLENIQLTKLVNVLENDFEHILIETNSIDGYPIIYKLDIFTGDKEEIENGNDYDINEWFVDRKGNIRLGINNEDDKIKFYMKNTVGEWENKSDLNFDLEGKTFINQKISFLDFDYDENIIYLATSINHPRWQIIKYDIEKKIIVDTVFQDDKYDVGNPINPDTKLLFMDSEKELIGIRYEKDKPHTEWFNQKFKDYQDTLNKYYPGYFVDIFDWNSDASILLVNLFSDFDPGNIMIYNSENKKHIFYASFANHLLDYELSKTEVINFKARDDYELEGYLNMPVSDTNRTRPFIIMPHGGPYVRDYWNYDPVVQFFSNQGYGVLRINFRGSTGYGIDHLLSGVKKISSLMIDDIADGVNWVISNNLADSNNIFLYGHSYGGYAAIQSIINYPQIYKAAVSIAAPTDINELMDYFDDQDNEFNYEFWKTTVGDPASEDEYLESISPIYNIEKIKRPLFLFHGDNDQIIPVTQTEEFVEEAEDYGLTIDYKIIKEEDHSISENRNVEYILKKSLQFYMDNMISK